ncbi:DNA/RNA polymerase superfamily protein [Gossypium australe]|uniref:DNA/RNA polymerase superfamily protein n=1 Tax=Gossypium australe TaxID=47621 RepID=A0A5B6WIQ9_9ROSI|nr:DNA/RNA polymerase superfamily protein [Gossypium australe]
MGASYNGFCIRIACDSEEERLDLEIQDLPRDFGVNFKSLATKLNFSTSYHPQIDRQSERVKQILKDML